MIYIERNKLEGSIYRKGLTFWTGEVTALGIRLSILLFGWVFIVKLRIRNNNAFLMMDNLQKTSGKINYDHRRILFSSGIYKNNWSIH